LKDIGTDLIKTADALQNKERGLEAASMFRSRLESVRERWKKTEFKPSIYWEWWPKPLFTPGKLNWLTEISEAAGAKNLFADVELASVQTEWQDVVNRKPDFICLAWVGVRREKIQKSMVKKRPGFKLLTEISDEKILILKEELFCRPSPRLLDGLEKLASLIH
jgi:iron complex transport system substrate-binding protein